MRQQDVTELAKRLRSREAENKLLGAIIDDLREASAPPPPAAAPAPSQPAQRHAEPAAQRRASARHDAAPAQREAEDALLEMHRDSQVAREALRRQARMLATEQRTSAAVRSHHSGRRPTMCDAPFWSTPQDVC